MASLRLAGCEWGNRNSCVRFKLCQNVGEVITNYSRDFVWKRTVLPLGQYLLIDQHQDL